MILGQVWSGHIRQDDSVSYGLGTAGQMILGQVWSGHIRQDDSGSGLVWARPDDSVSLWSGHITSDDMDSRPYIAIII